MSIALIAAMAKDRVIGFHNKMPWHLPADLRHFKQITLNHPIVMGRKTFESIGVPLPGRRNVVITRQKDLALPGVEVFHSLESALAALKGEPEIMIIGGQTLFEQAFAKANKLYLTYIELSTEGDTFFPAWDEQAWELLTCEKHQADEKNPYAYEFVEYVRK